MSSSSKAKRIDVDEVDGIEARLRRETTPVDLKICELAVSERHRQLRGLIELD